MSEARTGAVPSPVRVAVFVERYLQPEQTFIARQMNALPGCEVLFLARYRLEGHPFGGHNVRFVNAEGGGQQGALAWRLHRLRQRLTKRYASLAGPEEAALRALLSEFGADIVHAHWGPDSLLVAPVARQLAVPLVVHFHGYDVSRLVVDEVYVRSLRRLFEEMALALTVSEDMRRRVVSLGCPEERVVAHHTGVPDEYFGPPRRREPDDHGPFVFLQAGRLAEKKGHRAAIEAFTRVHSSRPTDRLRLVGEGPLRTELERLVASLGLGNCVEFAGRQEPSQVLAEMRGADALLAPSQTAPDGDMEGIPNVVVEAMAAGLPVIGTSHGGIPEAVRYSEPGWLVREGDVEGLSSRMERLASDAELWNKLSREGRQIAREHFHLPTQNRLLVELYRRVLATAP